MAELVKFKVEHLGRLLDGESESYFGPQVTAENFRHLENARFAYTILSEGKPILCGGVHLYWENRGETWAFLDKNSRSKFLELHNIVKRVLNECPVRRIEAAVAVDFEPGHRWMRALGFREEAQRLQAYFPDGTDCAMYAKVRA